MQLPSLSIIFISFTRYPPSLPYTYQSISWSSHSTPLTSVLSSSESTFTHSLHGMYSASPYSQGVPQPLTHYTLPHFFTSKFIHVLSSYIAIVTALWHLFSVSGLRLLPYNTAGTTDPVKSFHHIDTRRKSFMFQCSCHLPSVCHFLNCIYRFKLLLSLYRSHQFLV